MTKITATVPRTPVSHIPNEVSTRLLATSPKLSNSSRKNFTKARGKKINVEIQEPKSIQEKYCAKLCSLSLRQLGRQLNQARLQVKIAQGRGQRADPDSTEAQQYKKIAALQLYRLGWIEQEYQRRTARPVPKHFCDFSEAEIEAIRKATAEEVAINEAP